MDKQHMGEKRNQIAARDTALPRMGERALLMESSLHAFLTSMCASSGGRGRVTGGKGTGIIVAEVGVDARRVFKIEISQVEGPQ